MIWWPTLLVIIGTFFGAIGAVFFKKGSGELYTNLKDALKNLKNKNLWIGIFFYCAAIVVYLIALKKEKLTYVYPLASLTYIWIALLSVKYLGERMNAAKVWGFILIIGGVILVGLGNV